MPNIIVLLDSEEEIEALRLYTMNDDNGCTLGRKYHRSDWSHLHKAYVIHVSTDKKAFEVRLKFIYIGKGVEFL